MAPGHLPQLYRALCFWCGNSLLKGVLCVIRLLDAPIAPVAADDLLKGASVSFFEKPCLPANALYTI